MRLCNTDLQINCFTFSHLYVVVQLVWIAAFLVSTKFEHFRCQPPGKISYCCFGAPVLCTGALFCTLFLIRKRLRPYRCRSPPSDFDFCHQLKHRNWRKLLWRKSIFGIITRIIHRTWSLRCRMKLLCCFGNICCWKKPIGFVHTAIKHFTWPWTPWWTRWRDWASPLRKRVRPASQAGR